MRLYLIRHGQSENNLAEHTGDPRSEDPALTEVGHVQATRLADYMTSRCDPYPVFDPPNTSYDGTFGLTHLVVSPMRRALQTALPLADSGPYPTEVWDDTHEMGGIWLEREPDVFVGLAGMTRAEMEQDFPGFTLPPRITATGWWNRERETRQEAYARGKTVAARLEELARQQEHAVVALVAHQAFLAVLLQALLAIELPNVWFQHYNTGVTRIDFVKPDVKLVRYVNRIDHLNADCSTT